MGRGVAQAGTVRIGAGGLARLSPDLFTCDSLMMREFNRGKKQLRLFRADDHKWAGLKVYKSAPGSRSGTVSLMSILKICGLQDAVGKTFRARWEHNELIIDFRKALYDATAAVA